jgi:hypothetical protein
VATPSRPDHGPIMAEFPRRLPRRPDGGHAQGHGHRPDDGREAPEDTLVDELTGLQRMTSVASLDPSRLKKDLRARVADVKTLLGRHPRQARQMLPEASQREDQDGSNRRGAGRRGYRFRGNLSIGRLLSGEALRLGTREILVTPAGFEPAISTLKGL